MSTIDKVILLCTENPWWLKFCRDSHRIINFYSYAVLFYLMEPFKKRRISNLFVLFCLSVGGANLVFYYQVELAARLYCPREVGPWLQMQYYYHFLFSSSTGSLSSSQDCLNVIPVIIIPVIPVIPVRSWLSSNLAQIEWIVNNVHNKIKLLSNSISLPSHQHY